MTQERPVSPAAEAQTSSDDGPPGAVSAENLARAAEFMEEEEGATSRFAGAYAVAGLAAGENPRLIEDRMAAWAA